MGRALKFASLLPQPRRFHRSRRDTSPDCLGLTHSLVLAEAERGGGAFKVAAICLALTRRRELRPDKGGGGRQRPRWLPPSLGAAPLSVPPEVEDRGASDRELPQQRCNCPSNSRKEKN